MNSIEINIINPKKEINIFVDKKNNTININNIKKNITEEEITELIRIIRTWKTTYNKDNAIDKTKIIIKINGDNYIDTIEYNGNYPNNYNQLIEWIGEVNESTNI